MLKFELLFSHNVQIVFAGMLLLGAVSGSIGSFSLLRKRALIGDVLAHSALPGIGIAFLLTGSKAFHILLLGAFLAGIIGIVCINLIVKQSKIKDDAALAIILTVFYGVGIVILTFIQKSGIGGQAGLDKFLFGQSSGMLFQDAVTISITGIIIFGIVMMFFKEFKLLSFNPEYASTLGYNTYGLDLLLMGLTVSAVVIGLQSVGVVLMAALLIIPPATARIWTDNLTKMILLSAMFGALSGLFGSWLSLSAPKLPSGPLTVVVATFFFAITLIGAPKKGLIAKWANHLSFRRDIALENLLRTAVELLEEQKGTSNQHIDLHLISQKRSFAPKELHIALSKSVQNGYINLPSKEHLQFTEDGFLFAQKLVKRHRLWEWYLMHRAEIPADHIARDADENEHFLTDDMLSRLEEIATRYGYDIVLNPTIRQSNV